MFNVVSRSAPLVIPLLLFFLVKRQTIGAEVLSGTDPIGTARVPADAFSISHHLAPPDAVCDIPEELLP